MKSLKHFGVQKRLKPILALLVLATATMGISACNKPKLYGTIQSSPAKVHYYQDVSPSDAIRATREALTARGYAVKDVEDKNTLETYWQPTTADSHYVEVFGRPDYGTVGAYYRLQVTVAPEKGGSEVSITNVAKSFITNLKSSYREEDELFHKIDDFTRKRDVQVTNIGLQ